MRKLSYIIVAMALIGTGCGYSLRLSGGPSVDTVGRNGYDIRVELSVGPGDATGNCTTGAYVGGGSMGKDGEDGTFASG